MAGPQVRYLSTVEAVADVGPSAKIDVVDAARGAVVAEVARSCRLDPAEVIVRWATTEDGGFGFRAVVSEAESDHKPMPPRPPGVRGERSAVAHRAEVAP